MRRAGVYCFAVQPSYDGPLPVLAQPAYQLLSFFRVPNAYGRLECDVRVFAGVQLFQSGLRNLVQCKALEELGPLRRH